MRLAWRVSLVRQSAHHPFRSRVSVVVPDEPERDRAACAALADLAERYPWDTLQTIGRPEPFVVEDEET